MNDSTSPPALEPMAAPPAANNRGWMAITSLVLGIINLCAMFIPFCGGVLPIVGLVLGILALGSNRRGMAIAGIVLAVITLCFAIVVSISFPFLRNAFGFNGFGR